MTENKRIELLDALRGLSIIAMIFYHLGYDLWAFELFSNNNALKAILSIVLSAKFEYIVLLFQIIFIGLAGISSNFSRNNIKRGLRILVASAVITVASLLINIPIWFGILHFMAFSVLIYAFLQRFAKPVLKLPAALWALLFIAAYIISEKINPVEADISVLGISLNPLLSVLGFYTSDFSSADYFPLFPYIFIFLAGAKIGEAIKLHKFPKWFYEFKIPFLPFVGRHTLIIYLLHQPIIYIIVSLLDKLL